jgi:hypothetical protein
MMGGSNQSIVLDPKQDFSKLLEFEKVILWTQTFLKTAKNKQNSPTQKKTKKTIQNRLQTDTIADKPGS